MIAPNKTIGYRTVNSNARVTIPFDSISHLIANKDETRSNNVNNDEDTCWIHFHSGKCIHVKEKYTDVVDDYNHYVDNI